jgi:HSP20 family molecular chaperone IbpA
MDTIRKRTTIVGVATLIVGLALGLGIGVWGIKTSQASSAVSPKSETVQSTPKNAAQEPDINRSDDWDPFREMERMHRQIDRVIRDATEQFQLGSSGNLFRPDAGYSSSFDLRDRKDRFELRAYLPDAEASSVNVKIDNDRMLRVSVNQKKEEVKKDTASEARVTQLGQYEQVITLPEAVKSADMKVQRNGHEVVITIPKASS